MPPHCCTDLLSGAEVFSTIVHFSLALNLAAPALCITLKICPYVSSKIYQLSLLTQSNIYCFQHCRANIAEQQAISTSCSIIKIASYILISDTLSLQWRCIEKKKKRYNFQLWIWFSKLSLKLKIPTPTTLKKRTYFSWAVNEHLNTGRIDKAEWIGYFLL